MNGCGICGGIGPKETWAEAWFPDPGRPAPPNFERLQWTGLTLDYGLRFVYRCAECKAFFLLTIGTTSSLASTDYEDYTLERRPPPSLAALGSEEEVELFALQCCQRGDFTTLERLLDDERMRVAVMRTLAGVVAERHPPSVALERPTVPGTSTAVSPGADLTPLEPRLRAFLSGPPDAAEVAARALARHLLRQARHAELQALLGTAGPVQSGAILAMQDARREAHSFGHVGSGVHDAVRALMLLYVRTRAWPAAIELVEDLGTCRPAAETIRDIAQGTLPVAGRLDLSPLERALRRASKAPDTAWINEPYEAAAAALEAVRKARSRG